MSDSDVIVARSETPEEWRAIPGFMGRYEASTLGGIRCVELYGKPCCRPKPTHKNAWGYRFVVIEINGKSHSVTVGRAVLLAFLGEPPTPKHQVNHLDGNIGNDRLNNLEWASPSANTRHAFDTGLCIGKKVGAGKVRLDASKAEEIRRLQGLESAKDLGVRFGLSASAIHAVWRGRTWSRQHPESKDGTIQASTPSAQDHRGRTRDNYDSHGPGQPCR